MTDLTKRVRRVSNVIDTMNGGRRPILIELTEGGKMIRLKPKGLRHWFAIDIYSVYRMAAMAEAKALVKAKKEARKAKLEARRRGLA